MPEAIRVKPSGDLHLVDSGEISLFGLGWRDVADRLEKASVVEPVDPFEGCELDGLQRFPRPATTDDLGLVKAVDALGESVVVAIADTADGRFDAGLHQALGVFDRDILAAPVAMMDEAAATYRASVVKSLFQGIEDEAGMRRAAYPPADDTPGECIDDERHIYKALSGRDVGEVGDPEHVRRRRLELAVDAVQWAMGRLVADRRPDRLAADRAL